jgi:hypothetical protein
MHQVWYHLGTGMASVMTGETKDKRAGKEMSAKEKLKKKMFQVQGERAYCSQLSLKEQEKGRGFTRTECYRYMGGRRGIHQI